MSPTLILRVKLPRGRRADDIVLGDVVARTQTATVFRARLNGTETVAVKKFHTSQAGNKFGEKDKREIMIMRSLPPPPSTKLLPRVHGQGANGLAASAGG